MCSDCSVSGEHTGGQSILDQGAAVTLRRLDLAVRVLGAEVKGVSVEHESEGIACERRQQLGERAGAGKNARKSERDLSAGPTPLTFAAQWLARPP